MVALTIVLIGVVIRRMSRYLHQRAVIAEAIAQLGEQALTVGEPDELLSAALGVAVRALHTEYGTALRRLPDGRLVVAGEVGPASCPAGTVIPLAARGSYALHVVQTGIPFVSSDLRQETRITPPTPLIDRGIVSGIAVPLPGVDGPVGVLAVHARRARRFTAHEVAMLQALASVVATAWEQVNLRERLNHQAWHDPLTGVPNRPLLLDRLAQALSRRPSARDSQARVAVALIDLDDFKAVNDGLGHAAGDFVLKAVANRLASAVRPGDTLARFGGDESLYFAMCARRAGRERNLGSLADGMLGPTGSGRSGADRDRQRRRCTDRGRSCTGDDGRIAVTGGGHCALPREIPRWWEGRTLR